MKRVLVGMDCSQGSTDALLWAAQLARGCGAEVVVVAAFQRAQAELTPTDAEKLRLDAERMLTTEWVKPARELAPIRTLAIEGDPRDVLLHAADAEDADLVVVGSVGAGSAPGFLHFGSVAEYLTHHVTRPLAVVPAGVRGPVGQILLGVHGSTRDRTAVRWTAEVAAALDAAVLAVTVMIQPVDRDDHAMEPLIRDWTEPITRAGVELLAITVGGSLPADGLLQAADRYRADVVVMGAPRVGMTSRQRVGGAGIKLLHHTKLATVLVPAEWKLGDHAMA